jgi:hypothetical protein
MTPRHSATRAATLCGTAVLGACVVVSLVGFGSPRIESKDTARIDTHHAAFPSADPAPVNPLPATAIAKTEKLGDDVMAPGPSVTETAAWAEPESIIETKAPDAQNIKTAGSGQTQPVIEAVTTDSLHAGQAETLAAQAPEMSPVPMTTAEAPESPHTEAEYAVSALETFDECPVPDICIDQYLWSAYQRTPKRDTVKEVEHKKVTIRKKGKTRTINKTVTKLLDEDFTWKDVKAAERASMSLKDYVIGGMDPSFKLKLYHALRALEEAGLEPGITSAFRDDYRQSLAKGLKAASDRSYHGGSAHGGYGHGLAADVVSVRGATRAERCASSDLLWKWIDAQGKEFGVGRPYLDRDPPHVGPIDGKEYAAHQHKDTGKHAALERRKRQRLAARDEHGSAKRAKIARPSRVRLISPHQADSRNWSVRRWRGSIASASLLGAP